MKPLVLIVDDEPAIAELIDLPALASSFIRSKMTMFESAATPIVRIRPAMPGSVIVIGMSLISANR